MDHSHYLYLYTPKVTVPSFLEAIKVIKWQCLQCPAPYKDLHLSHLSLLFWSPLKGSPSIPQTSPPQGLTLPIRLSPIVYWSSPDKFTRLGCDTTHSVTSCQWLKVNQGKLTNTTHQGFPHKSPPSSTDQLTTRSKLSKGNQPSQFAQDHWGFSSKSQEASQSWTSEMVSHPHLFISTGLPLTRLLNCVHVSPKLEKPCLEPLLCPIFSQESHS